MKACVRTACGARKANARAEGRLSFLTMRTSLDEILARTVNGASGVPGVVAIVTGRDGTLYEGAAGERALGSGVLMTPDTVLALFSCTKAITAVALMQLVEEGRVALDDRADAYVPDIATVPVLDHFAADGTPVLRPPTTPITLRHLVHHTAGFAYDFMNADQRRYGEVTGTRVTSRSTRAWVKTPLAHDPGTGWHYGASIDWIGFVVEEVRGHRLGDVMRDRIFAPLGMTDAAFYVTPTMASRVATMHQREADGAVVALPGRTVYAPPPLDTGGGGLYATARDYAAFMRLFLRDGHGLHGPVLRPETVAMMVRDGIGDLSTGGWTSTMPTVANSGEFSPGVPKGWAISFQVNRAPLPTGRPAGSLMWAGLGNLFYWIDLQTGIAGFWGTQLLPFLDPTSYDGFVAFETATYRAHGRPDGAS